VMLEKRPGTALAVFPPPIFVGSSFVLWFRVSLPPPGENGSGIFNIRGFRSSP
jgi:hypothetical protein